MLLRLRRPGPGVLTAILTAITFFKKHPVFAEN